MLKDGTKEYRGERRGGVETRLYETLKHENEFHSIRSVVDMKFPILSWCKII